MAEGLVSTHAKVVGLNPGSFPFDLVSSETHFLKPNSATRRRYRCFQLNVHHSGSNQNPKQAVIQHHIFVQRCCSSEHREVWCNINNFLLM